MHARTHRVCTRQDKAGQGRAGQGRVRQDEVEEKCSGKMFCSRQPVACLRGRMHIHANLDMLDAEERPDRGYTRC
jgi:hypothetical protein